MATATGAFMAVKVWFSFKFFALKFQSPCTCFSFVTQQMIFLVKGFLALRTNVHFHTMADRETLQYL